TNWGGKVDRAVSVIVAQSCSRWAGADAEWTIRNSASQRSVRRPGRLLAERKNKEKRKRRAAGPAAEQPAELPCPAPSRKQPLSEEYQVNAAFLLMTTAWLAGADGPIGAPVMAPSYGSYGSCSSCGTCGTCGSCGSACSDCCEKESCFSRMRHRMSHSKGDD